MITREQLSVIARNAGLALYEQEKEYLIHIFLKNLYELSSDFIFKGGTCLRVAYNYQRFSEDLDFNTKLGAERMKEIVHKVLEGFAKLGIGHRIKEERVFENSYTAVMFFEGPLFAGDPKTVNRLSIDVGFRGGTVLKPVWKEVASPYPDILSYSVLVMDEREMFTEKISALMTREKARDLFDLWCMIGKGISLDKTMLQEKLKTKDTNKLVPKFCSEKEYEKELGRLVKTLPDYEQVVDDVKRFLDKNLLETS